VSRVKILGHMNIAEWRLPQDNHSRFEQKDQRIDVWPLIIPTVHGESVVMRALDAAANLKQLHDVGLPVHQSESLQHMV